MTTAFAASSSGGLKQAPAVVAAQVLTFLGPHPSLHVSKRDFADGMAELNKCLRSLCKSQLRHWERRERKRTDADWRKSSEDALHASSSLAAFLLDPDFAALSATYGMPITGQRSAAARGRAMRSRSNPGIYLSPLYTSTCPYLSLSHLSPSLPPGASFFNKLEARYFALRE